MMTEFFPIYNNQSIRHGLQQVYTEINDLLSPLTEQEWEQHPPDKWTAEGHLKHLILSSKVVAGALKRTDAELAFLGSPANSELNFPQLYERYLEMLANGQKSTAEYEPKQLEHASQSEALASWQMISEKFQQRLPHWDEERLDRIALPHPALGLLSMRQILFFTIFHTRHHHDLIVKTLVPA